MAGIIVLLIILGCAVFQFLKGSIVRAFATIVVAVFACIIAFGFFEILANLLIKRGNSGSMLAVVPWAHSLGFLLLFVIVFAVLQTVVIQMTRKHDIDLGFLPERIGRVVLGIILGLIISGVLMTFLVMAPLSSKYPYERFDPRNLKVDSPKKVLLNVDGFVTGLFSVVSNGSLSSKRNFACMRPNILDQFFLNRLDNDVSLVCGSSQAIEIPREKAVWPASEDIKTQIEELNSEGKFSRSPGKPTKPIGTYQVMIVRVGLKKKAVTREQKINAGIFTLSQLRLICKPRAGEGGPLEGEGINVYPLGYFKTAGQIVADPKIALKQDDFLRDSTTKNIDFIFAVPGGLVPSLVEFKLNNVVQIPKSAILTDASDAPPPAAIEQTSEAQSIREQPQEPETSEEAEQEQTETPPAEDSATESEDSPQETRTERLTESLTGLQMNEDL